MISIGSLVQERVQKVENMAIISIVCGFEWLIMFQRLDPFRVVSLLSYFLEDLNLIVRSLEIVWWAFHDLNSYIVGILEILSEPDRWKMPPTEFLHENISVLKDLTDVARVIAANLIVFDALILAVVFLIEMENEFL